MAVSFLDAKDANNITVSVKTTENGGIHTPHHNLDTIGAGASVDIGAIVDSPWAGSGAGSMISVLKGIYAGAVAAKPTEYTKDAAAPATPVGGMFMAVRRDTLSSSEVSADGQRPSPRIG